MGRYSGMVIISGIFLGVVTVMACMYFIEPVAALICGVSAALAYIFVLWLVIRKRAKKENGNSLSPGDDE